MEPVSRNFIALFWHQPRRLLLRKAVFYVHLVLGLTVGLLMSITCLTGSLVVYKPEIESVALGAISHFVPTESRATVSLQSALTTCSSNGRIAKSSRLTFMRNLILPGASI